MFQFDDVIMRCEFKIRCIFCLVPGCCTKWNIVYHFQYYQKNTCRELSQFSQWHCMNIMPSDITGKWIVCSTACSAVKQTVKFHINGQNPLVTCDFRHERPVMQKAIPCHDVIMTNNWYPITHTWGGEIWCVFNLLWPSDAIWWHRSG